MTLPRVKVLVTAVGGAGIGHEVLKALRMASRERYELLACDANALVFGFRDADAHFVVPLARDPGYVDHIVALATSSGAQVLIPGSEAELKVLVAHRERFDRENILLLTNSASVVDTCLDKTMTMQALQRLGFRTPRWFRGGVDAFEEHLAWDASIIKPASGGGGSNMTFIGQSPEETRFFVDYVRRAGHDAMVQEYVGDVKQEYTVGVLHSLDGVLISTVALRRDIMTALSNRSRMLARDGDTQRWLAVSSGVSQGAIVSMPHLASACEAIAEGLGSRGPLNIQLRLVGDEIVPFEINPRFSGTTCFRALAGCNEPDLLIRHHLLGEPLSRVVARTGTALRALEEYFVPDA